MRSFIKWVFFVLFWSAFACAAGGLGWSVHGDRYDGLFWLSTVAVFACFVCSVLSAAGMWVFTSPRLGRRVIHDAGNFYIELVVENQSSYRVKTRLLVYRDHLVYKRKVHSCELSGPDLSEDAVRTELDGCLKNYVAEMSLRRKIRGASREPIVMLSTQVKRAGRIRELFR